MTVTRRSYYTFPVNEGIYWINLDNTSTRIFVNVIQLHKHFVFFSTSPIFLRIHERKASPFCLYVPSFFALSFLRDIFHKIIALMGHEFILLKNPGVTLSACVMPFFISFHSTTTYLLPWQQNKFSSHVKKDH